MSNRIPSLDGIRGLAIGLVLLWHGFFGPLRALPNHPFLSQLIWLGRLSWSGVDLFFVLSGFLIGGILLDAAESKNYFSTFYLRRAHRIVPLYATLLVFVFMIPLAFRNTGVSWIVNRIPFQYYLGFLQNIWIARHADFGSNVLGVTWSLAVEEQFYLTLPFAIRFVSRPRLWWIVGAMVVGAPLFRLLLSLTTANGLVASYFLTPCRADALGLGLAAALVTRDARLWQGAVRHRKSVYVAFGTTLVAVICILFSGFTPESKQLLGLEYSLLAVLYFLLLLTTLLSGKFDSAFSLPALRYLGTIAYGLYLFHLTCMAAVRALAAHIYRGESGWLVVAVAVSGIGLAVVLAAISWKYFEKPLIRRGHRYHYSDQLIQQEAPLPALT